MKATQTAALLQFLQGGGAITPLEALREFGIGRLAARIHDLREAGFPVRQEMIQVGEGKKVARYRLESTLKSTDSALRASESVDKPKMAIGYQCPQCKGLIVVRKVLLDPRYAEGQCPKCQKRVIGVIQ